MINIECTVIGINSFIRNLRTERIYRFLSSASEKLSNLMTELMLYKGFVVLSKTGEA